MISTNGVRKLEEKSKDSRDVRALHCQSKFEVLQSSTAYYQKQAHYNQIIQFLSGTATTVEPGKVINTSLRYKLKCKGFKLL